MDLLVSAEWLASHLGDPQLVIVDSSWDMPSSGRSGRGEYLEAHIPGARFLDIDELSDRSNPAPHMLPSATSFGQAMERLGIGSADHIVVYDNSPIHTAARGWFMLHHFGAETVAILDGGLKAWISQGRPVEAGEAQPRRVSFDSRTRGEIVTKEQLLAGAGLPWIDARGRPRFEGSEADPRPGVAPGHAPGARNLPFGSLYREDGRFKPIDEIRHLFADAGIDPTRPFVASCGSGVTANSLIFAAHLIGNEDARLYDGSWSEWGADPATPKALGPA
jgi:thiosulfate/3-mercaptopyruvate sulfurtransferase